jgi:hypothetical protein
MSFSIKEIDLNNKKDKKAFVDLPWSIYKNDPHWVAPFKMAVNDLLNIKKHPFYKTAHVKAWVAIKGNVIVGRIMAIHNFSFNTYEKNKIGHFGMYEVINDQAISDALIDTASEYLKSQGMTSIQGPMNPGTNYECGLLVDKFDDAPQVMMTYNPAYYETLLLKKGFTKTMDLLAYNFNPQSVLPKLILDIAERADKKTRVTYRTVNLKNWTKELDIIFEIYNSAWESNWGFVPMSKEEFTHTAKDMKSIINPELIQFALVDGIEAGFILTIPDLNQIFKTIPSGNLSPMAIYKLMTPKKRVTRARVIMMGIKKEYRKMGLETLLYRNTQKTLLKNPHIRNVELSWILESNLEMNKPLIRMTGEAYKRYRLVEKAL